MKTKLLLFFACVFMTFANYSKAQLPTGSDHIDINNIDAIISSSSDLFWDFNNAGFEVPKDSGKHAIFAAGIWLGGIDNGSNIHLAGQTYRQTGIDFWPGPIDTTTGTPFNYLPYDRCWKMTAAEVQDHIQNYNTPNYIVPSAIADWPGFDVTSGRVLAPFADYNGNGIYDPANGDYPFIMGDMTVYSIFNDAYLHTETNCNMLGVEVHRTTYGFNDPANPGLYNSIFMRYEIKNYSSNTYNDFYFTKWVDFDLGNAMDDYVGTDLNLDMIYCYNGDNDDETASGYGVNPPAVGVYLLNQTLSSSVAFENVNAVPYGNPQSCSDFLNYSRGLWLDNLPITYGANGRVISNPVTTYMYPGVTDPAYYPTLGEWSEISALNAPNDRRIIGSTGPYTLNALDYLTVDVGYTWARADSGGPMGSLAELQDEVNNMRIMYDNGLLTAVQHPQMHNDANISVYPNPATEKITIKNNFTAGKYNVLITDAIGKKVFKQSYSSSAECIIKTSALQQGVYFITVNYGENRSVKKLIIQ